MQKITTIAELIRAIESQFSNQKALAEKQGSEWLFTSHQQFIQEIKALSHWFLEAGVKKGDKVGILALPSPRWTTVDLACMAIGAVTVPLFGNISEENFVFECTQTNLKTICVAGEEQWTMWSKHHDLYERTLALDNLYGSRICIDYDTALAQGEALVTKDPGSFNRLLDQVQPEDLATIIYTSGSTGIPKGVMLTNRNLVGIIHCDPMNWNKETDRYLSILPLAHVFGRSLNFIMIYWGLPVYYFNDLKNVGLACKEIHPTIVALVPRLLEKIYAKMVDNVDHAGFLKRTIGQWAFSLANQEEHGILKDLMLPVADKVVYSHLREALGGALRVVISGGAPLNPHLCHFFIDIGLPIYEGFGMTEASIVCCNRPENRKIGSVGLPIEGITVKTSDAGELLIKGPIVLTGYYQNPKATSEAFNEEGWLRTGDKAVIDEEGFITIVGRIKELIKTSVGEYIAPVPIEQQLGNAPIVDMAMIVADNRKFVSCLLFPNFDVVERIKKEHGAENKTNEEFLDSPYIQDEMNRLIENVNSHINHWEQIRAFRFVLTPPTVETGELTPSMKIRREVVTKKYKDLIDTMYPVEAKT